jgi:hopanoid-associated phosphorylase
VTGLAAEARIAAAPQVVTVSGGGDRTALAAQIETAIAAGAGAVISFGIAGGLAPGLESGSCLVARAVLTPDGARYETDRRWAQRLSALVGSAPIVDLVGVDTPVAGCRDKRRLHVDTGAVAVDMESHIAAEIAARHGIPFAAFRVVADTAEHSLPHAAVVGMRRDGSIAIAAVLGSLLRNPLQLAGLLRTALDARAAFAALFRGRKMVSGSFGFGDLRELVLDVPGEDVFSRSLPV